MLGEDLLVAPVFNEAGIVDFYVPAGKWTNLLTNEVHEGSQFHQAKYDYFNLPLLVKPNTVLAIGSVDNQAVYDYAEAVTLHVFELADGASAETAIYTKDGDLVANVTVSRAGQAITVDAPGLTNFNVLLRNVTASGEQATAHELGTLFNGLAQSASLTLN